MNASRTTQRVDGGLATFVGALATAALSLPLVAQAGPAGPAGPADDGRMVEAAAAALSTHLRPRTEAFRISPRPLAAGAVPPEPEAAVVVRPLAAGAAVESRMRVWVDVHASARDGGRFLRSLPVAFEVTGTRAGWVATRDMPAGVAMAQALQDGSVRRASIDIAAVPFIPVTAWTDGVRLRRALRMGEAIAASHLESAPAVARGDIVSLHVKGALIGVEAKAEALQDGGRGMEVWVRVAQGTAPVRARVIGVAAVEMQP